MSTTEKTEGIPTYIKMENIHPSTTNPRKSFGEVFITQLAQSIKENGLLQKITVRPKGPKDYEIVFGENRYRACKELGWSGMECLVRQMTDEEVKVAQIVENLHRADVHWMQEAEGYKALLAHQPNEGLELKIEAIAKSVGKSKTYIAQRLKLTDLISEIKQIAMEDRMYIGDAFFVANLAPDVQKKLYKEELAKIKGTVDLDDRTKKDLSGNLDNAPFDVQDPNLVKKMGACITCPFNSACNTILFPDLVDKRCSNISCYMEKAKLSFKQRFDDAKEDPGVVLISDSYGRTTEVQQLINKGVKVYDRYQHDVKRGPEVPTLEDYDSEDYTEEEAKKQLEKDLKYYEKQLKEHQKAIESGNYLKAFYVDGNRKGQYCYVTVRKETNNGTTKKEKAAPGKEGQVKIDVAAEIARITANKKRKLELDENGNQAAIYDLLYGDADANKGNDEKFFYKKSALSKLETAALIIMLMEQSHAQSWLKKDDILALKGSYGPEDPKYLPKLLACSDARLQQMINALVRHNILDTLRPGKEDRPDNKAHAALLRKIVEVEYPKEYKAILDGTKEKQDKYLERCKQRIDSLRAQAKTKPAKEAAPAKKAAKKSKKK